MNLVPAGAGYALRLDLVAIREMIADYLAQDLWASALDPGLGALELVVATRSEVVNTADRARVAPPPPHVRIELVDAGHWLRIDAPGRIVELVATRLPQVG